VRDTRVAPTFGRLCAAIDKIATAECRCVAVGGGACLPLAQAHRQLADSRVRSGDVLFGQKSVLPGYQCLLLQLSNGSHLRRSKIGARHDPGVATTVIVRWPDFGACISKAIIRVPGLGESHSCRGLAVSI
jgi:hypothetical protein